MTRSQLPPVLLLDGSQRACLAVARSLGAKGVPVHIGAHARRSLAGGSRFAVSESVLPDPLVAPEEFRHSVAELAARTASRVILPITEASHLALLDGREELAPYVLPCGSMDAFRNATDKVLVRKVGGQAGLAVPEEWEFHPGGERPSIPAEAFPIVVKPRRSVHQAGSTRRQDSATYVESAEALPPLLDAAAAAGVELIGQRRIHGPGIGVFLLRWEGRVLARFAHRRIREKPPSGGVSVCSQSTALPEALEQQAARLLEQLDWNGAAMVEFKRDVDTGRDVLLEVNPRFWGSLQLAIDAGVDFPWLLLQAALGAAKQGPAAWAVGLHSRWMLGELDHLIALTTTPRRRLHLPPEAPGAWRTLADVLRGPSGTSRFDVARASDARPAWRELSSWFRALFPTRGR